MGIIYFNVFLIFVCFDSYSLLTICLLFFRPSMKVCVCLILTMHGGLIRKKTKRIKCQIFVVLNAYMYDTNIFFDKCDSPTTDLLRVTLVSVKGS